ncbi:MAG: WbqC family protein [Saprospiraceae bacterium]
MSALLELQYLPPLSYFSQLLHYQTVILGQHEHYVKRTYRNRCQIAGANGVLRLSIPLAKGKNSGVPIRKIRISNRENWQQHHWQSIQSAYGNAPFFEYYADELQPYFERKYELLWEWNWDLLQEILALLQLQVDLKLSDEYVKTTSEEVVDLRNRFSPRNIPLAPFKGGRYPQVFQEKTGFLPNLSILDLLFCQGPAAVTYLVR